MKVIILAAGRGSRLNELTERRPKCMVEIFGKPILHWQLEAIATAGLKDAVIVCGYEKNMIEADCQKIENPRWAERPPAVCPFGCRPWPAASYC